MQLSKLPGPSSRLVSTIAIFRDEKGTLSTWHARYGKMYVVQTTSSKVVVLNRPELVEMLFSAKPEVFGPFLGELSRPVVGQHSLLLQSGSNHARQRRLLSPPFNSRSAMPKLHEIISKLSARRVRTMKPGMEFTALKLGLDIALETIVRVVYGITDDDEVEGLAEDVRAGLAGLHPSFLWVPRLQHPWFGPYRKFSHGIQRWKNSLRTIIERRRRDDDARQRDDILSLLLCAQVGEDEPLSDDEIVDQLRTLLFGGYETTAHSFAWAMEVLHRHPLELERIRAEVDELDVAPDGRLDARAVLELPLLNAACNEVLRMHPILGFVGRSLIHPLTLDGHDLPPGTIVGVPPLEIHRNRELYADPDRFIPDRFLQRKCQPSEYLPFGGGHRRCLAAALAHCELRIALATCFRLGQYELLSPTPARDVRRGGTYAPHDGSPLRVIAHRSPVRRTYSSALAAEI